MIKHVLKVLVLFACFTALTHIQAFAGTFTAFGPKTSVRGSGNPVTETGSFNIKNPKPRTRQET